MVAELATINRSKSTFDCSLAGEPARALLYLLTALPEAVSANP